LAKFRARSNSVQGALRHAGGGRTLLRFEKNGRRKNIAGSFQKRRKTAQEGKGCKPIGKEDKQFLVQKSGADLKKKKRAENEKRTSLEKKKILGGGGRWEEEKN